MLIPGSIWYPKQNGYIKTTYANKNIGIEIESIMISKDKAYVTFNIGVRRITMDAIEFRRKFEK